MNRRLFALWVLEMSTGMRRCELAGLRRDARDRDQRALVSFETRVVVDGRVVDSDGKSDNANRIIALDPFTFACLDRQLATIEAEKGRITGTMA